MNHLLMFSQVAMILCAGELSCENKSVSQLFWGHFCSDSGLQFLQYCAEIIAVDRSSFIYEYYVAKIPRKPTPLCVWPIELPSAALEPSCQNQWIAGHSFCSLSCDSGSSSKSPPDSASARAYSLPKFARVRIFVPVSACQCHTATKYCFSFSKSYGIC